MEPNACPRHAKSGRIKFPPWAREAALAMSVLACRDIEGSGRNRGVVKDVWSRPAEAGMHKISDGSMPHSDGDLERSVTSYFGLDFPDQRL